MTSTRHPNINQRLYKLFQWREIRIKIGTIVIKSLILFGSIILTLQLTGNYGVVIQFFNTHFWQVIQLMLISMFIHLTCSIIADALKVFFKELFASDET